MGRGYGRFGVDWQAVSVSMDCKGNWGLSFVYNNLKIEGMGYCTVNLGGQTLNQYAVILLKLK